VLPNLVKAWKNNPFILAILGYAFSTILGSVIDGIHHLFYEDKPSITHFITLTPDSADAASVKENESAKKKFEAISNEHRLNTYLHFLEDDLYYPYEAWANISVAMVPGFFLWVALLLRGYWSLLNVWLWDVNLHSSDLWLLLFLLLLYIFIFLVMVFEAKQTLQQNMDDEEQFTSALMGSNTEKGNTDESRST
jgi:hypothetical protein